MSDYVAINATKSHQQLNLSIPHQAEFWPETKHATDSHNKAPKRSMNAKVKSRYSVASEPILTILGATGVAYGWYVKKYNASHYEEKNVAGVEESHDWTFTHDDRTGTRTTGDPSSHYKAFAAQFHSESWNDKQKTVAKSAVNNMLGNYKDLAVYTSSPKKIPQEGVVYGRV